VSGSGSEGTCACAACVHVRAYASIRTRPSAAPPAARSPLPPPPAPTFPPAGVRAPRRGRVRQGPLPDRRRLWHRREGRRILLPRPLLLPHRPHAGAGRGRLAPFASRRLFLHAWRRGGGIPGPRAAVAGASAPAFEEKSTQPHPSPLAPDAPLQGFDLADGAHLTLVKKVMYNGQPIDASWPLGAAIDELSAPPPATPGAEGAAAAAGAAAAGGGAEQRRRRRGWRRRRAAA
jgi:hypothetical protein